MSFKFERLKVWQKAVDLADHVDEISRHFPKGECYILTSQIKRAANSVSLNIAEGSTGQSNAEFNRFLSIALRSNIEVVGCLHLAIRRNYIDFMQFQKVSNLCEEILVMINALKTSLGHK